MDLNIEISIQYASLERAGLAVCEFLRNELRNGTVITSCSVITDNTVSHKFSRVIMAILGVRLWLKSSFPRGTTHLLLDDDAIDALACQATERRTEEMTVIVPHMFLLPLFQRFWSHFKTCGDFGNPTVYAAFDYIDSDDVPEGISACYERERDCVLSFLQENHIQWIDTSRRLLLENLISLLCYIVPAKYLIFIDDDVFLASGNAVKDFLKSLRAGYHMVGYFDEVTKRVHTAFFGICTSALWQSLDLFDDGKNLYVETWQDTGSITFAKLNATSSVAVLGPYRDGNNEWGFHLGHCTSEIWCDLPQIISHHGGLTRSRYDNISDVLKELAPESMSMKSQLSYVPITDAVRRNAYRTPKRYYAQLRRNLSWLTEATTQ